jgi:hypothetical protein
MKKMQVFLLLLGLLPIVSCNQELKTAKLVVTPWDSIEFSTYLTKFDPIFSDLCVHHYLVDSFTSKTFYLNPKNFFSKEPIAFCIEPFCLSNEKPIRITQIEDFILNRNLKVSNIREKIYWMCQTTKAKIIKNKNQYGDLQGYSAIVGKEVIPKEYYYVFNNFDKDEISPYPIILGEEQLGNSFFRYYIQIDKMKGVGPIHEPTGTPILLNDKSIKPVNAILKLFIKVESCYSVKVVDNMYVIADRLIPYEKKLVFDK